MKIIHVIDTLTQGGAEVLLFNSIKALPEHEHILVILIDFMQMDPNELNLNEFICLNGGHKSTWPRMIMQLRRIIKKHQPDLVHAHLQLAGLITKMACPKKIPFFYTLHSPYGPDGFSQNRLARFAENFTAKPYHHLIGVSKLVLDDYRQYVSGFGTEDILYNFVPEDFFKKVAHNYIPGQPLKCISVGSLGRAKNYPYTLQQFYKIKHLPITLDIYGEGEADKELQEYINLHELSNVKLMGRTDYVKELLPQYQLYIITSTYEGFGLAPLEAMAVSLPVIISDIPAFREVIDNGGMYIDLNEESGLSRVLNRIFDGLIDLQAYRQLGLARAKEIASAGQYKNTLLKIYNKYLG